MHLLFAAMALTTAAMIDEAKDSRRFINGWLVNEMPLSKGCAAITSYDGSSTLVIHYVYGPDDARISFSDPRFKSLKDGDKQVLKTYFQTKGRLDDGWGDVDFVAQVSDDTTRLRSQRLVGRTFLTDIARADTVAFFRGERVVAAFPLKGSAEVVAELRRCALGFEKKHPSDPFED